MSDTAKKRDISAVRDILFDTLEALKDKDNPMPIEQAKAINEVAQTIINSAKVEVEHIKIFQGTAVASGFIPLHEMETVPGTGVTVKRHTIR